MNIVNVRTVASGCSAKKYYIRAVRSACRRGHILIVSTNEYTIKVQDQLIGISAYIFNRNGNVIPGFCIHQNVKGTGSCYKPSICVYTYQSESACTGCITCIHIRVPYPLYKRKCSVRIVKSKIKICRHCKITVWELLVNII